MTESTGYPFSYDDPSMNFGFFAYRSGNDTVELGFKISANLTDFKKEVLDKKPDLVESALDLICRLSDANHLDVSDIDFDLVDEGAIDIVAPDSIAVGEPFALFMPHILRDGEPFCLMLRADASLSGVRESMAKASLDGKPMRNLIKIDVVRAHDDDMRLLEFYEELTGDMS